MHAAIIIKAFYAARIFNSTDPGVCGFWFPLLSSRYAKEGISLSSRNLRSWQGIV
jgi:hypothetical protein